MKLRRSCVSFALVLLLSFVSLAPCFIDLAEASTSTSNIGEYCLDLYPFVSGVSDIGWHSFSVPCDDYIGLYGMNLNVTSTTGWQGVSFNSNIFQAADYDRTIVFTISPVIYSGSGLVDYQWGSDGSTCDVVWKTDTDDANTFYTLSDGCTVRGTFRNETNLVSRSAPYTYFVTVPATANYIEVKSAFTNQWQVVSDGGTVVINYDCFGAYVLNTADRDIVSLVQQILDQLQDTDTDIENIGQTLSTVVNQLIALNTDTDTIVSLLGVLEDLSSRQLTQLVKISGSVDAIYYFLTEEMASESAQVGQQAQDAMSNIDNTQQAQDYYFNSMKHDYDALNLDGFTFHPVLLDGLYFVFDIFSGILHQFGETYELFFTFPLMLGMAFLVIGRISKAAGKRGTGDKGNSHGKSGED